MVNRRSDDTFRGARNLQLNKKVGDSLGQKDRVDFYKFRTSGQVDFTLALQGLQANASVKLLNEKRAPIATSNQSGQRAERISTALDIGTYYIEVRMLERRGKTRYNLRTFATSTLPPTSVGDETIATAFDIGTLSTTYVKQESVGANDPVDFYKFTLNDIANLQVRVNGLTAGTKFELIRDSNSNGLVDSNEILTSSSSFGANSLAQTTQDLPPGTYFIKIESTSIQSTQYQLNLIPTLFKGNLSPDPGNTLPLASNILGAFSGTRSIREYVGIVDPTDVYRFTLNDLSNLQVSFSGSSREVEVQLIRDGNNNGLIDSGEIFAKREQIGSSGTLTQDLPTGTYFMLVQPEINSSFSTSYQMDLVATPYGGNGLADPGNTLSTARDLGVVSGTSSQKEYIGVLDSADFYKFTLNNAATLQATLAISSTASPSANNNIRLIQDINNNGLIDSNEILRFGIASFNPASLTRDLQAGTYFLQIEPRFSSFSNNYELTLSIP